MYRWKYVKSGNPNKAWIVNPESGAKLSPLMSAKAANDLCTVHNMIVGYIENQVNEQRVERR